MIAQGGKSIYGATLGILMLDARFPRIPGDMGNATTWPFPVHYRIVRGASPDRVVRNRAEGLLDDFAEAGKELIADGVDLLTTNCGFLALHQQALAAQFSVPFASSSLMQIPMINALLPPGRRAGIVTISAESLSGDHLQAIGLDADIPVCGVDPQGEFASAILGNRDQMDVAKAETENVNAALELAAVPDVGAIVLECTNMAPYAAAIRRETGLPVFSIFNFISWLQQSAVPPVWGDMTK